MSIVLSPEELKNQKVGKTVSIILHILFLFFLLLSFLPYQVPPPGQSGVLVSFGEPEQGRNDDRAAAAPVEEEKEVEEQEEVKEPLKEVKPPKPKPTKPKPTKVVNTDDNSKERSIRQQKKKERDAKLAEERAEELAEQKRENEIQRKKDAIERKKQEAIAAKQKAADAAKRKREADAQALKDAISTGLSGTGQGSGTGGANGDQGQPDGDPNGKALDGISTGAGDIGGGLGNRGVLFAPKISNNSQKTGKVVVKVCVNSAGKVVSANYTQGGSSTNDSGLIATAEASARKYKFTKGTIDRQCGTITIIFKLK